MNASDQLTANDKVQGSPDLYEKLMEKLSSPTPPETTGKDATDAAMTVNEVGRDMKAPPGTNDHAAAKVQKKTNNCARSKVHGEDDSTARKETPAPHSGTKSKAAPTEKASTLSSAEEGEIKTKPSAPTRRIPVQESTPQTASSRKKTPPTRNPTATTIVPTEPRAERNVFKTLEAKLPVPKRKEAQGDAAPARPSASRSDGKRGHGRQGRQGDDKHKTREVHKAPPPPSSSHNVYVRPSREKRPLPATPAAPRPIEDRSRDVQSSDFQDLPDLRDWLYLTGWDNPGYRQGELSRMRRQEQIDIESAELKAEGEREKARLKEEFAEGSKAGQHPSGIAGPRPLLLPPKPPKPAEHSMLGQYTVTSGIKRERGEESDGDAYGGEAAKYYRTNRHHRGSRAGFYHHGGREDSSRQQQAREGKPRLAFPPISSSFPTANLLSPPDRRRSDIFSPSRGFPDSPPSQSRPPRYLRQHFRSPAGHPLPRDEFDDAQRETDRYVTTRDRLPPPPPPRHRSPRPGSSPPRGRGSNNSSRFRESDYGRLSGPNED